MICLLPAPPSPHKDLFLRLLPLDRAGGLVFFGRSLFRLLLGVILTLLLFILVRILVNLKTLPIEEGVPLANKRVNSPVSSPAFRKRHHVLRDNVHGASDGRVGRRQSSRTFENVRLLLDVEGPREGRSVGML